MKRLTCPYCQRSFRPHPRVGRRQKTCGSPSCKKARKAQTNARWRKGNPDCCQNDYPRVKEWLGQHPDYLEKYRQSHPEYVEKNCQAQKHRDRRKKIHLDIQASIPIQPLEMNFLFGSFPCLDIQAQMDRLSCLRENGTILSRR